MHSNEGFQGCIGNLTINNNQINLNSTVTDGELGEICLCLMGVRFSLVPYMEDLYPCLQVENTHKIVFSDLAVNGQIHWVWILAD